MKKFLYIFTMGLAVAAMAAPNGNGLGRAMMRDRQQNRNRPQNNRANGANGAAPQKAMQAAPGMITADRNDREKKTGGDFAFNYSTAPLALLIEDYQNVTKKTVIPDPDVEKTLTQTITFQSLEGQQFTDEERILTLEMLLEMRGVHLEPYGEKFYRAIPRDKARKDGVPIVADEAEITEGGRVISRFIKLKYVSYEEMQKALEGFKSDKGNFVVFERINTILVTDTELNIARMLEVVKAIDIETPINEQVFVRQIKNASAQDIQQQLQKIVEDSQKELEKTGKGVLNAQNQQQNRQQPFPNRFGQRNQPQQQQQPAAATPQNLLASISDADRGMIRGKVLVIADERSNKLIIVTSKTNMDFFDKVIDQLDIETTPDTVVKVYRLKYAEAEEVSDMINDLIGNAPSSKSSTKGNQNQSAKNGQNANMTKNTTSPAGSANKRTGEAKPGELSKENTTILADKRINGLVVMTSKELVPVVEDIIQSMDVKLSQVLIETVIIEVTLGDDIKTGVDWVQNGRLHGENTTATRTKTGANGLPVYKFYNQSTGKTAEYESGDGVNPLGDSTGDWTVFGDALTETFSVGGALNKAATFTGSSGYASLLGGGASGGKEAQALTNLLGSAINYVFKSDKLNLSAIINATKTDTRAKYLASPIIMTVDNKEATIDATESRKFFSGYETSNNYSYQTKTPKYDTKDIGIKIKVTPKINPNGTVMLNIEEEYSQLGAGQSILVGEGSAKELIDTSLTRKMTADALLENEQTVILTGLTETYKSDKETGIPILKDIPWIGRWLFGSVSSEESRKELLIFMTPYVLNTGDEAQAEAKRRKETFSDQRAWDDHGWSKSKLADPVSKREQLRRLKEKWSKQDEDRKAQIAIEKAKVDRVDELEALEKEENRLWFEMHEKEMSEEDREFFRDALENSSKSERREAANDIRKKKLTKAESEIKAAEKDAEAKVSEAEAAEAEAGQPVEETQSVEEVQSVEGEQPVEPEQSVEEAPSEASEATEPATAADVEAEDEGATEGEEPAESQEEPAPEADAAPSKSKMKAKGNRTPGWYLALRLALAQQPYVASCLERCLPVKPEQDE